MTKVEMIAWTHARVDLTLRHVNDFFFYWPEIIVAYKCIGQEIECIVPFENRSASGWTIPFEWLDDLSRVICVWTSIKRASKNGKFDNSNKIINFLTKNIYIHNIDVKTLDLTEYTRKIRQYLIQWIAKKKKYKISNRIVKNKKFLLPNIVHFLKNKTDFNILWLSLGNHGIKFLRTKYNVQDWSFTTHFHSEENADVSQLFGFQKLFSINYMKSHFRWVLHLRYTIQLQYFICTIG